jgi:hypothetical protein
MSFLKQPSDDRSFASVLFGLWSTANSMQWSLLCWSICSGLGRLDVQFVSSIMDSDVLSQLNEYLVFVRLLWPLLFAKDGSSEANDAEDCKTGSTCFAVLLALYSYIVLYVALYCLP